MLWSCQTYLMNALETMNITLITNQRYGYKEKEQKYSANMFYFY